MERIEQYTHDGLTFDVRDTGPIDGEVIVLLHGFPQDKRSWALVEPMLHAEGYRTLAPDQRGYSPGARPRARRAYRGDILAADVIALLDAAGLPQAHIVGHDWGGAVAWGIAGLHPDRVRTLTVLSTPHPGAMMRAGLRGQLLRSWYMFAFQLPVLPELVVGSGDRLAKGLERAGMPADSAAHNAGRMREPGAARGGLNWYRGLPFSLRTPVGRITVPTTYVWSRGDTFLGRAAAEATAATVTADYRFVELSGDHWLPENQPREVADAILARVRGASPVAAGANAG